MLEERRRSFSDALARFDEIGPALLAGQGARVNYVLVAYTPELLLKKLSEENVLQSVHVFVGGNHGTVVNIVAILNILSVYFFDRLMSEHRVQLDSIDLLENYDPECPLPKRRRLREKGKQRAREREADESESEEDKSDREQEETFDGVYVGKRLPREI